MKKILSVMLAVLMLVSVVSTLAPLASAEDMATTGETIYAYYSTVTVDGMAGGFEPGLMVQNYFNNKARFGAAWDYNNVYIVVNGVPVEHIEAVHLTVGTAAVSVTDNPAEDEKGSLNVVSYCGAKANSSPDCIEVAIPLSQVMLRLEDGDLVADFAMMVETDSGADTVEGKLILSNRALFFRSALYDGGGSMGKNGLDNRYGEADGQSFNNPQEFVFGINYKGDYSYEFTDAAVGTTKVRLQAVAHQLYRSVTPDKGGAHHVDFEINIASLPEYDGDSFAIESIGDYGNPFPFLMFTIGSRNALEDAESTKLYIYNKKGSGLMLRVAFPDSSANEIALKDFGVELGVDFKFGVNVNGDNSLDLLIDDDVVRTYTKRSYGKGGGSSSQGYLIVCAQRNYTLKENEEIKFTIKNVGFSNLISIDTDKVLSLSKNAAKAPVYIEDAGVGAVVKDGEVDSFYGAAINVGSLTKVRAAFDTTTGYLSLYFNILTVGKIKLEIGGKTLVIDVAKTEVANGTKKLPGLDATVSGIEGANVKTNKNTTSTGLEVWFPIDELEMETLENGVKKLDFKAEVSSFPAYEGAEYGILKATGEGSFLVVIEDDIKATEITNPVVNFEHPAGMGISSTSGMIKFVDTKVKMEERTGAVRAYALNRAVDYLKIRQEVKVAMDIKLDALPAVSVADLGPEKSSGGWLSEGKNSAIPHARLNVVAQRPLADGLGSEALCYTIYNTTEDGLVLVITQQDGEPLDKKTFTTVKLGKQAGDTFNLAIVWALDGSAKVYVNKNLKGEIEYAIGAVGVNNAPALIGRNAGTFSINYYRNSDIPEGQDAAFEISGITVGNHVEEAWATAPIKLKYVQTSAADGGSFDTRFISTIDSLAFTKVGYEIRIDGESEVKDVSANEVYTSFINGGQKITAPKGEHFVILSESDLPVSGDTYTVIVRPYAIGMDGKANYGTSFAIDYVDGKMVENSVHTYVYFQSSDLDPFNGSKLVALDSSTDVTLDALKNSVIYDLGLVQNVNRAVLTSDNSKFAHFNKNSFGLYYSEDNITYHYVREYSVLTVGNKVYFYNFDVDARYIKINSTANTSFSGEGRISNTIDNILTAYYSDKPLLAEDEFLMSTTVDIKNEKDVVANNMVYEFTLDDLGIDAADVKEDMSDIRFKMGGTLLPHYYSNGIFYVRVIKLEANEEAKLTVLYNNETAASVSHGDEVFEVQYGTKYGTVQERNGWCNSVVTLPNGDLMEMISSGGKLYYYRSENGGMTWSELTLIEASNGQDIGEQGGFILDEVTGKLFFFAYTLDTNLPDRNDWYCYYKIFLSEDNGYTWEYVGTPTGKDGKPAPQYALSYSNGLRWSKADGPDGPGVDYVFTTGQCYDFESISFCTTAMYSTDEGKTWIFSDSKINYNLSDASYWEGGLSEETIYEKQDGSGTLMFYARCQVEGVDHFAKSYSYDGGITWEPLTTESFSNIYTVNTQPIIELTEDGTPVFMWGGNNSMGGRSYKRFPFSMAVSYDDGENFVDILDASLQTPLAMLTRLHTNPDMTFYMHDGMDNCWLTTTGYRLYILNSDDFLYKTKGAFDSFEDTAINLEGWLFATGSAFLSSKGATDGRQALRFAESTIGTRSIHYLEEGKVTFDFTANKLGNGVDFELQTAYNDSRAITAPIRVLVDANGELCYYASNDADAKKIGTGLKIADGANTLTIEFNGNTEEVTFTLNGESADAAWIDGIDNAVCYFNVFTSIGADISIDRLMVVRTDK